MLIRHINLSMKVKELFELTDQRKLDRRGAIEKSELIMLLEALDQKNRYVGGIAFKKP